MSGSHPLNSQSMPPAARSDESDTRRKQLVEVTIDSLAEVGYVGSTLAHIASRAGVSPGLVAHYFGDKDGLFEAAFRRLSLRVSEQVKRRLSHARTPRGRIQAVIDANLAPEEFDRRTGGAWLAFWGQVLHVARLKDIQVVYQRRMLSNLRYSLKQLVPPDEAKNLATMIAAMIDGVWLRAALSEWREADSEGARALLTTFVDGRLQEAKSQRALGAAARSEIRASGAESFRTINPATGETLAEFKCAGCLWSLLAKMVQTERLGVQ